jgi:hypothetical protein
VLKLLQRLRSPSLWLLVSLALGACEPPPAESRDREALYLRVEVEQQGRTLAAPHLLGFEGRHIVVEKRSPHAAQPDYRLDLVPREEGAAYLVRFELELPAGPQVGRVALLHGEERRVVLDGDTQLKLMLMRVDSPEFRALVMRDRGRQAAI